MALPQFKWERIKYFSPEAIFLNSKEPDCAETENIFAFKPKQGYFFPETQDSVILLCSERLILQAVKKRLLDNVGARGHKAILFPTQCTETSCLSAGSCWKQLCCSWWSLWPNQLRSSWWDFKCSLFAERIHRIFWGRSWEEQRNDTAKANCVVMAVLKGQHLLQCKQSICVEGGGLGVVRHEILPKWEGGKKDPSMEVRETEPKPSRRGGLRKKGCWGRQSSERPPVVCWGAQWSRGAKGG